MKTRILPLILTSIMLLTFAAGCSSEPALSYQTGSVETSAKEKPETEEASAAVSETVIKATEEPAAVDYSDVEETTTAVTTKTTTTAAATTGAAATTKAAAATTTAPPPAAANAPAAIKDLNNETIVKYDAISPQYKLTSDISYYLCNFNKALTRGFGADGSALTTEAEYGIRGLVTDRKITFTLYDHTGSKSVDEIRFQALDASCGNELRDVKKAAQFSIDASSFTNGLYRVVVTFSGGAEISIYFYINGNDAFLCEMETIDAATEKLQAERRAGLLKVLKAGNVTPANSLSLDKVCYPFKVLNEGERCDTQLWIDLSRTFIDDRWTDEYKLYVLQAWIRENIAYDYYVSDTLNVSRAQYYDDLTGKQSAYDLRAGVCFDYANIIAIICRANGIPAVTIGSESMNHVWNVVYINNRWMEYDAVMSAQYYVKKDTTVRAKSGKDIYSGVFAPLNLNTTDGLIPSDAEANKYFQYDSLYLF